MDLVSVALWTLALALVGLGIFALFEGWLRLRGRRAKAPIGRRQAASHTALMQVALQRGAYLAQGSSVEGSPPLIRALRRDTDPLLNAIDRRAQWMSNAGTAHRGGYYGGGGFGGVSLIVLIIVLVLLFGGGRLW